MLHGAFKIIPQARFQNLSLAKKNGKNLFHLRPDILLMDSQTHQASLFIDSKYKRLTPSARSLGVTHEDVYQMLAYATRLNCPLGLVLYPQIAEESPLRQVFDIENTQIRIGIATINLNGPMQTPAGLIQEWQEILTWVNGLKSE
jgi:5-methylcytosine-specific restriction endonuclease McrBC regulatory subunit McrC